MPSNVPVKAGCLGLAENLHVNYPWSVTEPEAV